MEIIARVSEDPGVAFKNIPTFDSPSLEMRYLAGLSDTEEIISQNEKILKFCEENDNKRFKLTLTLRKHPMLIWHTVKVFNKVLENKNYEQLNHLIENKLDLSHSAFRGTIPRVIIMLSGLEEEIEKMIKTLIEGGMLIDDSEENTCSTGLHIACLRLDVSAVKILLKYEANPNSINNFKLMPLNIVENEDCDEAKEIKNILVKAGAQSKWNSYMD